MQRKSRWQSAACALSGLVVWAVVWWPALSGGRVIYYSDAANQNLPLRSYVGQSLAQGHVPLWCPAILRGIPLAGQQASEWCPSTWLMALPVGDKALLFTLLTALVYLLAWYGQWLLGRRLGLAAWAAALAATAFAYCGPLPARHVFVNMIEVMAALPWVVLGADLAAREKGGKAWGGVLLVAAAAAWMMTAFYPQIVLFIAATVVAFGLASRRWRGGWGRVLAGAAVGLLLGLPQLLPFAELVRWNGAGEPRGYGYMMRYAPRMRAIAATLLPGLWGKAGLWLGGGNYEDGFVSLGGGGRMSKPDGSLYTSTEAPVPEVRPPRHRRCSGLVKFALCNATLQAIGSGSGPGEHARAGAVVVRGGVGTKPGGSLGRTGGREGARGGEDRATSGGGSRSCGPSTRHTRERAVDGRERGGNRAKARVAGRKR